MYWCPMKIKKAINDWKYKENNMKFDFYLRINKIF